MPKEIVIRKGVASVVQKATPVESPKKSWLKSLFFVQSMSRRSFESKLAKLVNSALAHEQEKLPDGSDAYRRLDRMATRVIDEYCEKNPEIDRADLEAQIPAINKLRSLAEPKASRSRFGLGSFIGCSIAVIGSIAILGASCGVFEAARLFVINRLGQ